MNVYDLDDFSLWNDIALDCPTATFFHSPGWYEVFAAAFPEMSIKTQKIVFNDGKIAVFPLMERHISRYHSVYLSGPAGVYGGWISGDDLDNRQVSEMVTWILRRFKDINWRVNPFDSHLERVQTYVTGNDSTDLIHLDRFGDAEALKKSYKHSVRKQINKALKQGFRVKAAEDWREWETYYRLYLSALEKWGDKASSRYPVELFRQFFQLQRPGVKLWLIYHDDKIIGGNLNFYNNRHCVEWHAVFDDDFFKYGSRNLLVHHIIADASENGYRYYDFNPSGGHEGVRRFKKTFGTTGAESPVIKRTSTRNRVIQRLSRLKQALR